MLDIVTEFSIRRVYQMSDEYIQIGWARINDRGDIYDLRKHKPVADNLVELYIKKRLTQSDSVVESKKS